jgi:hypothetical protein
MKANEAQVDALLRHADRLQAENDELKGVRKPIETDANGTVTVDELRRSWGADLLATVDRSSRR